MALGGGTGRGGRAQEEGPEEEVEGGGNAREVPLGGEGGREVGFWSLQAQSASSSTTTARPSASFIVFPKLLRGAGRFFPSSFTNEGAQLLKAVVSVRGIRLGVKRPLLALFCNTTA